MNHSEIAKSGYANEQWLADLLSDWRTNSDAKKIIQYFGYDMDSVSDAYGIRLGNTGKVDVVLTVHQGNEKSQVGISCKKFSYSSGKGTGHVSRGIVDNYVFGFGLCYKVRESLMAYAGGYIVEGKKGVHFDHPFFCSKKKKEIIDGFRDNYDLVFTKLFSSQHFPPEYFAVTVENDDDRMLFVTELENVIEYAKGDRRVWFGREKTKHNLALGNVTMYRKGEELQFKMDYRAMIKSLGHRMRIFYINS
jgi:hypothetical protein